MPEVEPYLINGNETQFHDAIRGYQNSEFPGEGMQVKGGDPNVDGHANYPISDLADRTAYLKNAMDNINTSIGAISGTPYHLTSATVYGVIQDLDAYIGPAQTPEARENNPIKTDNTVNANVSALDKAIGKVSDYGANIISKSVSVIKNLFLLAENLVAHKSANSSVHGIDEDSDVVGTIDSQVLENKTLGYFSVRNVGVDTSIVMRYFLATYNGSFMIAKEYDSVSSSILQLKNIEEYGDVFQYSSIGSITPLYFGAYYKIKCKISFNTSSTDTVNLIYWTGTTEVVIDTIDLASGLSGFNVTLEGFHKPEEAAATSSQHGYYIKSTNLGSSTTVTRASLIVRFNGNGV